MVFRPNENKPGALMNRRDRLRGFRIAGRHEVDRLQRESDGVPSEVDDNDSTDVHHVGPTWHRTRASFWHVCPTCCAFPGHPCKKEGR
jgi:hypothetical protein